MKVPLSVLLIVVPLAYYALYAAVVKRLSRKKKLSHLSEGAFAPFVSVVIPTYNEKKMIEKRVKNFEDIEYPQDRLEVIFVDGASNDGTSELIKRLGREGRPLIQLVQQASRQGYNSAVYEGVCHAKSDIVVVGEVGGIFHPKALISVVRHLADPSIGVATGKSVLYNPNESLSTRLEAAYREAHDQIRYAESIVDSTPDMKGELLAFRRDIGLKLQPRETLPDNTSFDMAVSYMARSLGSRAIFDPEAIFYEYTPMKMKDRMMVQIRRGTTFAGAVWNYRSMILKSKFGYFGLLIAPSRLLMLIIFPWVLLIAFLLLLVEAFSAPLLGTVVLALAVLPLLYRKTRYVFLSFVLSQVVLAIATLRLLLRRHTQIITTVPTARR